MADGDALRGREQVCKVARGGGDGVGGERLVGVLRDVVFGDAGQVIFVVEILFLRGGGIRVDGGAGVFFEIVAAVVAFDAAEARPRPRHLGAGAAVLGGCCVGRALAGGSRAGLPGGVTSAGVADARHGR